MKLEIWEAVDEFRQSLFPFFPHHEMMQYFHDEPNFIFKNTRESEDDTKTLHFEHRDINVWIQVSEDFKRIHYKETPSRRVPRTLENLILFCKKHPELL